MREAVMTEHQLALNTAAHGRKVHHCHRSANRVLLALVLAASPLAVVGAADKAPVPWWLDAPDVPERFAVGVISTDAEESALNLTPDGQRVYFARSRVWFPASRIAAIFQVDRTASGWSEVVPAAFSRGFSDVDPFVSRDGRSIVFSSMRPVDGRPRKDFDLWSVRVHGGGFTPAVNLGPAINSDADELYPSMADDGTLYFGSERGRGAGGWDLYRARRNADGSYGAAETLGAPVNTSAWEYNPTIAPDGSFLIFTSLKRPGGADAGDLWIARREGDGFAAPQSLSAVNTPAEDHHPTLSPDGRTLFFLRRDAARGQAADFFWVSMRGALGKAPPR
jgi:Tol biopolymer transport system component